MAVTATTSPTRLDKLLWSVRLYKTRSIASEALRRGKVLIGGRQVKGSHTARVGEVVDIKVPGGTRSFRILAIPRSRIGAKLVADYLLEVTSTDNQEALDIYRMQRSMQRDRGLGRPTKRDRRDIDNYFDSEQAEEDFDIDFDLNDEEEDNGEDDAQ